MIPNLDIEINWKTVAVVGGLLVVGVWFTKRQAEKAVEVVKDTAEALNPVDENNIINKGFESVFEDITKQKFYETELADSIFSGPHKFLESIGL